jgi:hypothetical protein
MLQMNKYLASRGYTVFDVQYGLTDRITLPQLMIFYDFLSFVARHAPQIAEFTALGAPANVVGPFTLDNMARHPGIFTFYLTEHAGEYGASTDSVFITGDSAGGHLSTAASLATAGGQAGNGGGAGSRIKPLEKAAVFPFRKNARAACRYCKTSASLSRTILSLDRSAIMARISLGALPHMEV